MLLLKFLQPRDSELLDLISAAHTMGEVTGFFPDFTIRDFHSGLLGLAGP